MNKKQNKMMIGKMIRLIISCRCLRFNILDGIKVEND